MKRIIDIILSGSLLILLSPVVLLAMLLIRTCMGSPIFFLQVRTGLHGKPFVLWKLRTFIDPPGHDAVRSTRLGMLLRRSSIDELPNLWNVLRGDMSMVGPRPLLVKYLPLYNTTQHRRHEARPGITGWAQVNGRNRTPWKTRFELDVWYVDHRSFWIDLMIMARTFLQICRFNEAATGEPPSPDTFGETL